MAVWLVFKPASTIWWRPDVLRLQFSQFPGTMNLLAGSWILEGVRIWLHSSLTPSCFSCLLKMDVIFLEMYNICRQSGKKKVACYYTRAPFWHSALLIFLYNSRNLAVIYHELKSDEVYLNEGGKKWHRGEEGYSYLFSAWSANESSLSVLWKRHSEFVFVYVYVCVRERKLALVKLKKTWWRQEI